jgi:hypothetical protein
LLKGQVGDEINVLMAACVWNLRKWLIATAILLTKLGLSWISARSKHPKQDKEAQALYKKLQTKGNRCLACGHRLK